MEVPVVNLPRHRTYCFRDFPPGCGRSGAASAAQRKTEDKSPCPAPSQSLPPPTPPPPPPAGIDQGFNSGEGTPMANGDANQPVPSVITLASQQEEVLESSRIPLVEVNGDNKSRGIVSSCEEAMKLKSLELLDGISERDGTTVKLAESNGSIQADEVGKQVCYSKLYPPPKRRNISAVRNYPIGCGWNATPMSSEERLKLDRVPEKMLADQVPEKMLADQVPEIMLADQVPEKKLEVPVVHQVIKVSQTKEAQSSKSPSHVVGSHSTSDVMCKERMFSPTSTFVQLQKSREKDAEVDKSEHVDKVKDECLVITNQKISNEASKDSAKKVNVLALMAAPNCPWMKGRRSGASGSRPTAGKTKAKIGKPRPPEEFGLIGFEDNEGRLHELGKNGKYEKVLALHEGSGIPNINSNPTTSSSLTAQKAKFKIDNTPFPKQLVFTELVKEDSLAKHDESGSAENALSLYEGSNDRNMNISPIVPCGLTAQKVRAINGGRAPLRKQLVTELDSIEDALTEDEDIENDEETFALHEGSNECSLNITPLVHSCSNTGKKDVAARQKVENSLRLFRKAYREELHCQETQKNGPEKKRMVVMAAYNTLKSKGQCLATSKQIFGDVPGIEVGDKFKSRMELSVLGLHRPLRGRIGCAKRGGISVATSVVACGDFTDGMDSSDVLICSGSGGISGGTNKVPEDQKLQLGNLSLKNSISIKTPVRVVLGFKSRTKQVSTFTYAGLYRVEEYWDEKGPHGFKVFRFKLRKISGQPELSLQKDKRSKKLSICEGFCIKDISDGKERMPICVINKIDDDLPLPFNYITEIKYPSRHINTPPKGCDCRDDCSDTEKCACARKNGGKIPYNFNDDLVHVNKLVFECGPSCNCSSSCHNRVAQHGMKIPLEIFKTERRGWGVRSSHPIPSGAFICEYIGELLHDEEAEKRSNDEYLFDIGRNYDDPSLWKDLPDHMLDLQTNSSAGTLDSGYTIDAAEYGNVGRFINHSCSPNLYAQNVLYDHDDKRMPHVMFFAGCNIPPFQELTYDYNYKIDGLHDSEGNIKRKDCFCGSSECCGRLY